MDENIPKIDETCARLLEEIQQNCHIRFQEWNESYCAFKVENRDDDGNVQEGVVYFYKDCKSAHVCHELLHAKCDIQFENDVNILFRPKEENILAKKIFDFKYWETLSNHIQHKIIYKEYIKLGYVAKDFFSAVIFAGEGELKRFLKISSLKVDGKYDPSFLACYLQILPRLMFFPIDTRFKQYLRQLERMDNRLYKIYLNLFTVVKNVKLDEMGRKTLQKAELQISEVLYSFIKSDAINKPTEENLKTIDNLKDEHE